MTEFLGEQTFYRRLLHIYHHNIFFFRQISFIVLAIFFYLKFKGYYFFQVKPPMFFIL